MDDFDALFAATAANDDVVLAEQRPIVQRPNTTIDRGAEIPKTLDQSLANAAAKRDRALRDQARELGNASVSGVAGMLAALRAGKAIRPDAGMIDRIRLGRQARHLVTLEQGASNLNKLVGDYVRATPEIRSAMQDALVSGIKDAQRGLRDARGVVKHSSSQSVLTAYQESAGSISRSIQTIDAIGNAKRSGALDQVMADVKSTLERTSNHIRALVEQIRRFLG